MSRKLSSMAIVSSEAELSRMTNRLSGPTDRALPPGPIRAWVKNWASASTITALDTGPWGSKAVAETPLITPMAAIWLIAS